MTQSPRIHRIKFTDSRQNETKLSDNYWMDTKIFPFKCGAEGDGENEGVGKCDAKWLGRIWLQIDEK